MIEKNRKKFFNDNGQRFTKSREVLLNIFICEPERHFTIDELINILSKEDENNLTTLYNNLNTFLELNLVAEFNFKNKKHYELVHGIHGHFICDSCGDIFNVEVPGLSCLGMEIKAKYKAQVNTNTLEFNGVCQKCLEEKK